MSVIVLGGAVQLAHWATAPRPPAVDLAELDPTIVAVLQQSYEAVHRDPRSGATWGRLRTALLAYEFTGDAQILLRDAEQHDPSNPRPLVGPTSMGCRYFLTLPTTD